MKEIIKRNSISPAQIALIKRTVAKNASDDELTMFMHIAKKAGLDPFLKEIWFYKDNKGNTIMLTGRDGFLALAQKSGEFAGIQSAAVYENDEFAIDYSNNGIKHVAKAKDRGLIIGAWAKVFRKGCEPNITWVDMETYNKGYAVWKSHPAQMIVKCAEAISLKKLFGISGLTSMEEIGVEPQQLAEPEIDSEKALNDILRKIELLPKEKQADSLLKLLEIPPIELTEEMKEKIKSLYEKVKI